MLLAASNAPVCHLCGLFGKMSFVHILSGSFAFLLVNVACPFIYTAPFPPDNFLKSDLLTVVSF